MANVWIFNKCIFCWKCQSFHFSCFVPPSRCSRKHNYPTSSKTLLVRGMFITFGMEQCRRDDYDTDASLEYSDEETYQQFLEFYEDVLPEFQNVGKVVQFKVCIKVWFLSLKRNSVQHAPAKSCHCFYRAPSYSGWIFSPIPLKCYKSLCFYIASYSHSTVHLSHSPFFSYPVLKPQRVH